MLIARTHEICRIWVTLHNSFLVNMPLNKFTRGDSTQLPPEPVLVLVLCISTYCTPLSRDNAAKFGV